MCVYFHDNWFKWNIYAIHQGRFSPLLFPTTELMSLMSIQDQGPRLSPCFVEIHSVVFV